jgi:glycosyltransferase involved in cell wall biosynthesis
LSAALELVLLANTRLPSERAQGLQVMQMGAAFARAGARTSIVHARRARRVELPPGRDLFEHYQVPGVARPELVEVACSDWIEAVPRAMQFVPARLQELTFSRNAARMVLRQHARALVLSREIEAAQRLVAARHAHVFLEIHRVPEGRLRRHWLLSATSGARGVVAISGGVREDLIALGVAPQAIVVEHDGFEPARFDVVAPRDVARRELGLDTAARVVVYTGGLLAWKGVDVLVDAARTLPHVQFLVAGGAAHHVARLRTRAAALPNVRIDGFQPPERVATYLAAADLGVVPNRAEPAISARYTSPLKVFEAMAVGLPLIASDLPSLRELLVDRVDAWLVPPDDAQALAAAIDGALSDARLRSQIGQRLRARAAGHTWDARARRILEWMRARTT